MSSVSPSPQPPVAPGASAPGDGTPRVQVVELRKTFRSRGDTVAAVDGVSLSVGPSEMLVLLGPSGCGKTTLLRSIAGLEDPDSGEILIDGRRVYASEAKLDLPPERRGVSFVFQSYALWPHMTVLKNVVYPLRATGVGRREAQVRGEEALAVVGCEGLGRRYPSELSGGQQQRVALARAIVARRGLIFFDEPLSNIDAKVREKLRFELLNIRDAVGFAGIYVTHDQDEAMILGDRIAVMNAGRILQLGAPQEIYEEPHDRWVADFVGQANFVEGTVSASDAGWGALASPFGPIRAKCLASAPAAGEPGVAFFRPEWARILEAPADDGNCWPCRIKHTVYIGDRVEVLVEVEGHDFVVAAPERPQELERAWLHVPPARAQLLPA